MIEKRKYMCPTCGTKTEVETNHWGEVYSGCKNCLAGILYCIEPIAIDERNGWDKILVKVEHYRINVSTEEGYADYKVIEDRNKHLVCAAFINPQFSTRMKEIGKRSEGLITLYKPTQWKGQYVSSIGRLHDWEETIYPNEAIKEGYYIDFLGNEIRV